MHKSIQMTIFPNSSSAKVDYFLFPLYTAKTIDRVEHPCCLYFHGAFLGVFTSNFEILKYMRLSPTREQCGVINTLCLVTQDIDILVALYKSISMLIF